VPPRPGPAVVYRFFDALGVLLYVGITQNFGRRYADHEAQDPWWSQVARTTIDIYASWDQASQVETIARFTERPVYNSPPPVTQTAALHVLELTRMLAGGEIPRSNEILTAMLIELHRALTAHLRTQSP